MAVKKRVSLRSKSAKSAPAGKSAKASAHAPIITGPVPFLMQARASKSQKLDDRQRSFASRILNTQAKVIPSDPNQPGISKSAIRRRKRKARDQLKPKLNDLMDALGEAVPEAAVSNNGQIYDADADDEEVLETEKVKLDHRPNPHKNLNSANKIEKEEIKRFGGVLRDESFRKSPFEALKEAIRNNSSKY